MAQILPGIKAVGYVPCCYLQPDLVKKARAGLPVAVFADVVWMEIEGDATCQCITKAQNHGPVEETTLNFSTAGFVPYRSRMGYVVKCVDGSVWLIGAAEPPYPVAEVTQSSGNPSGDAAGCSVKVTWKGQKALIRLA